MATICRIERVLSIKDIKPNPHNARFHSTKQIVSFPKIPSAGVRA